MSEKYKTVSDSMGQLQIREDALYAAQTQRAIDNFPVSGQSMPRAFIEALLLIKEQAAIANGDLGCIEQPIANAIAACCQSLRQREDLMTHFPVDVFQTGSGTSTNMNANEVIATLVSQRLGTEISANDHVNFGQSSNDVIPTTIHVSAALACKNKLLPALTLLIDTIDAKARELTRFNKTGRTHLMDAMPVQFSQSVQSWADQLRQGKDSLLAVMPGIEKLALGGTAVGTGINTHPEFSGKVAELLAQATGIPFKPASNFFPLISSQDAAVALSGQLKSVAVSLMKIANDLRWMNSGPLAGLAEISLEALQPGSSIMPGTVNPVIPESTAMVCAQVMGNDVAISIGGQSGNFELNVMLPMIGHNLLNSLEILSNTSTLLANRAIKGFTVNEENLASALHRNPILVTALNPVIGYSAAAKIAKIAYSEGRPILDVALEHTDIAKEELEKILDPARLTRGGL